MGSSDLKVWWLQAWEGSVFQFIADGIVDAMFFDVDNFCSANEVISRLAVARHTIDSSQTQMFISCPSQTHLEELSPNAWYPSQTQN